MIHGPDHFHEADAVHRRHRNLSHYRDHYQQVAMKMLIHVKPPMHDTAIKSLIDRPKPSLADVLDAVSAVTAIKIADLVSHDRARRFCLARLIYYKLAHELSGQSLGAIGKHCGGRDHSTVINGLKRAERYKNTIAPAISAVTAFLLSSDFSQPVNNAHKSIESRTNQSTDDMVGGR